MKRYECQTQWMPETIGNYKIIGRLGKGGMGDIYKAVQVPLNRTVALKVLSPQMGRSEEFSKRFEIEAKAISMLQHHNIVSIYEYGEELGFKYFAMEYIDGYDLGARLRQKKLLVVTDIIDFSKQICRGLLYAHSSNIIHRDIKPQNVLIDKHKICKLTDFGIAKIFQETNITLTGMAVGTPEYMSPEQAEGQALDTQTDIYSLGIVIYEMLTKRPPFTGNNSVAIAYKQVHELPIPPSALRKDTPKRLELIILKALKKNRIERYRSVKEMLNDLDTVDIAEQYNDTSRVTLPRRNGGTTSVQIAIDRRITDRRSGDRRREGPKSVFTKAFWAEVWRNQNISLILITIVIVMFVIHFLTHAQ